MKVYKTRNVDEIIDGLEEGNLPGVPKKAEVLELALGNSFVKKYKQQYSLWYLCHILRHGYIHIS